MLALRLTTFLPEVTLPPQAPEPTRIDRVAGLTGALTVWVMTCPPPHHLRCWADQQGPRADAARSVAGAPGHALPG
jgi:hypothetical protein